MINKSKIKNIFAYVLEPFALGLLALLFIVPMITVMNLSPITKQLQKLDILGVTTKATDISVSLVEGKHNIFSAESLNTLDNRSYEYFVNIGKRGSDSYSKPILKVENESGEQKTLIFSGQTSTNTKSNIFLIVDQKSYKIQDDKGATYTREISFLPEEEKIVFLSVESLNSVQFSEDFSMTIKSPESI